MPAKDFYHDIFVQSLIKEGWTITDDPLTLSYGNRDMYVDLGAERTVIAAERDKEKIAVEIKSFIGASPVRDLEIAVGQYSIYQSVLSEIESNRILYLAVPLRVYESILSERFGQLILTNLNIKVIVFDHKNERIVKWIQ
ncbi:element excision factor XisH family protein [Desulfonema magnum]|uniref:XisH protein domain-conaining protein n=1 Tax=Desulfonema magnum TaxID=45655 RepID=A0A975BHB8_9BACT|nr:element excision factor XisH family protein [Desulfonema magnum]QTA85045.1 XisH protein domain-conaining protein [Desulfonema magnum]